MSRNRFYITTPIYYVNDEPHLGHAYTTILADVLARYHRLFSDDTLFLTGVDEHGQKVEQAAQARGISPKQQCDEMVERFKTLWQRLKISNDDFIRTTEPRHQVVVQALLQRLYDRGEVYKDSYEGWYCIPDERFWTDKDLIGGNCPECGRPTVKLSEENYFFRMSAHQDWLVEYITTHPDFIRPETRRNEILGFLRQPLGDLCISRPKARLSWGIPLPFDPNYVTYVWFDALTNYISAVGALSSDETHFRTWWPAYHLIGKDILTTHAVYWPTMLRAAGLEPPRGILAHGWWLVEETKMSKSLGNVVKPLDLITQYGVDAFRYFLMRDMTLGQDSQFSEEALVGRLNSDLANDLGNLLSRIVHMIGRYCEGVLPEPRYEQPVDQALREKAFEVCQRVYSGISGFRPHQAIEDTLELVRHTNRYLEETAPWRLVKEDQRERLQTVLYQAAEALRIAGALLGPVIPDKATQIRAQLGLSADPSATWEQLTAWGELKPGTRVPGGPPLFPRIQVEKSELSVRPPEKEEWIHLDDFRKLDLRVAVIEQVEPVPKADKLLKLQIDVGGKKRQLVAGIAQEYDMEGLIGKRIIVIANLEPAIIRGVRSEGMLLAADDGTTLSLLTPDRAVSSGTRVR